MGAKDCCNQRLEATTISEVLHLFGQGNLPFIREKSGKSQGIWKTDLCGNHGGGFKRYVFSISSIFSLFIKLQH